MGQADQERLILSNETQLVFKSLGFGDLKVQFTLLVNLEKVRIPLALVCHVLHLLEHLLFNQPSVIPQKLTNFQQPCSSFTDFLVEKPDSDD